MAKTWLFVFISIASNVAGNALVAIGTHSAGRLNSPLDYLLVLWNPWVISGILLMIVTLLSNAALLSWADLSFVLPVTSLAYVLSAVVGKVFLGESVSDARWAGVALITAGAALVSATRPRTAPAEAE